LSSLWLRIWLSFWTILVAVLLLSLFVDYVFAIHRSHNLNSLSPAAMADAGATTLERDGDSGAREWLAAQSKAHPELRTYIIGADGRELAGRRPDEAEAQVARGRPGRTFPAEVDRKVAGRPYRFMFVRVRTLPFDPWDILLAPWVLSSSIIIFSGAGAGLLARSFTSPVRELEEAVERVGEGRLETRTPAELTRRRDEIGSLARGIDIMATRIAEMVAAKDAILRDVSHELRAPLSRLRAAAQLARHKGTDASDRIDKEVDRLDALVGQILRYSRLTALPSFDVQPVDFSALAAEVVEDLRLEVERRHMSVMSTIEHGLIVKGDEALLRSSLENVLRNAARFNAEGEPIDVLASSDGRSVRFEVRDRGIGVSEADLPRIFEAFHGEGSGAGLGLAIVQRIVDLHGGTIDAQNRHGGGFLVSIELPAGSFPQVQVRPSE
jgi:two-component system, OmpR family, sensor kinase